MIPDPNRLFATTAVTVSLAGLAMRPDELHTHEPLVPGHPETGSVRHAQAGIATYIARF